MRQRIAPGNLIARSYGVVLAARQPWRNPAFDWNQVITSARGSFRLESGNAAWRISPGQALLIPVGNEFRINALESCDLRALFVQNIDLGPFRLVALTPLLRELIFFISWQGALSRDSEEDRALLLLTLSQLQLTSSIPLQAIWPRSQDLRAAAKLLVTDPGIHSSVEEAAKSVGLGKRTIERRFRDEVGAGVAEWRREHLLVRAAQELLAEVPVGDVAFKTGYGSPSSFIYAFKKKFGESPSRFKDRYLIASGNSRIEGEVFRV